jgi:fumarate reductase subunit D
MLIRQSFALGVVLAALIPYLALLLALLLPWGELSAEERAFRKFVGMVMGVVAVPLFLLLAALVFGLGQAVLKRLNIVEVWGFAAWGAVGSLVLLAVMLLLPPQQSVSGRLSAILTVLLVGAAAGTAFWAGAVRGLPPD